MSNSSSRKMSELRSNLSQIGIGQLNVRVLTGQKEWWTAQGNLSHAAGLIALIESREGSKEYDDIVYVMSNLKIRPIPQLGVGVYMMRNAAPGLGGIAKKYHECAKACIEFREIGQAALDAGDIEEAQYNFAMEYATAVKARGLRGLFDYFMNGGEKPEGEFDV